MKFPGGYQMVDMGGAIISTEQATTIVDAKNAKILRKTTKPVVFSGITIGNMETMCNAVIETDTGAVDGKVFSIIGPSGVYISVTTDDSNITFTPTQSS